MLLTGDVPVFEVHLGERTLDDPSTIKKIADTKLILEANPLLKGLLNLKREERLTADAAVAEWEKNPVLTFVANPAAIAEPQPVSSIQTLPAKNKPEKPETLLEFTRKKLKKFLPEEKHPYSDSELNSLLEKIKQLHETMDAAIIPTSTTLGARGNSQADIEAIRKKADAESNYIENAKNLFSHLDKISTKNAPAETLKQLQSYKDEFKALKNKHRSRYRCM